MTKPTLFIADIHLQPDDNHPINIAFHRFLQTEAVNAAALYILGDCFEMWVGDDVGCEVYAKTLIHFKDLTDAGVPIFMMYGNRDFLMRKRFWQHTGIQYIPEPGLIEINGMTALILHGDALCTDDHEFQKMRRILRHPVVTWLFLRLPKAKRIAIGEGMRMKSQKYNLNKAENIMDVNQASVEALFKQHPNVQHLIHGHTHRAAHHMFDKGNQTFHRWVLGDWRPEAQILKLQQNEFSLEPWTVD